MATCLLCHSPAPDQAIVCPACGGAVDRDDPTRVSDPAPGDPGATVTFGRHPAAPAGDPTRVSEPDPSPSAGPPVADPWGPPAGPPVGPPAAAGPYGPGPYGQVTSGQGTYGPGTYGPGPYGGGPPGGPAPWGAPGAAPWGAPAFTPAPPTSALAIWSLCLSICGAALGVFCYLPFLACPVGAVLGHVSLSRIARTGEQGRGIALAGVIIGWIATALMIVGIIVLIALIGAGGNA